MSSDNVARNNLLNADRSKSNKKFGDILGYKIETIREPHINTTASPAARGSVSLVRSDSQSLDSFDKIRQICAPNAIGMTSSHVSLDMGKCILCGRCRDAAPDLFELKSNFALPVKERADLVEQRNFEITSPDVEKIASHKAISSELRDKISKTLGRSLEVREVDAGSCNGCEVEINAMNNPIYDLEQYGIHFVSSPRHADVLLVTGPVSRNMEIALKRTYEATPDPKIVVAVGACGCSGGIFGDTYATVGGVAKVIPVDVYVPGCPPRPEAILYGLLLAVNKIDKTSIASKSISATLND
ncbi:MAG: NADH-quinone oxidoreductase subunit NuoB [Nitrososphaerales archaeon]|jgi:Ni,Fe-hydrogenase III small subunit/ferredoxin